MILAHDDVGAGTHAIVFVHGFPVDRRMWSAQLAALREEKTTSERVRFLAVDLPGFGASRDLAPARSIVDGADAIASFLDDMKIERATLCGLSMGGYVALAFAARHATKLAGLVLADTKATADSDEARAGRTANADRARKQGVSSVMEAMLPKLVGPRTTDETKRALRAMASEQPVESVVAALEAMADRHDRTNELAKIRVPTRVIVGSEDEVTPPSDAKAMVDRIAGAQLVQIAHAGHFSNLDAPGAFHRVIMELARSAP